MNNSSGSQVAVNAALIFIGKAFSSIAYILFFVVLSHAYSQEDYGTFRQIWMLSKDMTVGCLSLGIPIGILYFLARIETNQKRQFSFQSVRILLIAGLSGSILLYLIAPTLATQFGNPQLAPLLRQFSPFPILFLPMLAMESVFLAFGKTRYYSCFIIASKSLFLAIMLICTSLDMALSVLLDIVLVFALGELIVAMLLVHRFSTSMGGGDKGVSIRKQIAHSAPIGFSTVINILNVELDKLIVSVKLTVEQFALYANGAVVVPFIGTFAGAASSSLMAPMMERYDKGDIDSLLSLWRSTIVKVALIFYPLLAFLFVNAEAFVTLLFSATYAESAPVFQIYLLAQLPKIIFYGPFLMAIGKRRVPLIGAFIALSINALLSWFLIDWLGLTGPALATLISIYLVTLYYLVQLSQSLEARLRDVFPFKSAAVTGFISFVTAYTLSNIILWFDVTLDSVLSISVAYVVHSAIALMILRLLNIISQEDIAFISSSMRKFFGKLNNNKTM